MSVRSQSTVSQAPATAEAMPRLLAYPWRRLALGLGVVVLLGLLAASVGAVFIPPLTLGKMVLARLPGVDIARTWPETYETILWQLRLPRVVLAGLVGASLATSGATYQGLFRNPLADPYLIGVAAGAGLGATIVLSTGVPLYFHGVSLLPVAAFVGAFLSVALAYGIARRSGGVPLTTLILAGVAIASLAGAVTSLLMIRSNPDVRPLMSWLLGGFVGAGWRSSLIVLPYMAVGVLTMLAFGRILNVMQLDEDEARHLGVNVERTKLALIVAASLVTAAAVSVSGLIGFVGLIAPHAVRLIWGHDHRFLLPMSFLMGAGFLVLADLAARMALRPIELPVGLVTAFCGAPFFLYLLWRRRVSL
ncbi:MAG: iron ABC transporter permease [Chloroflexota bacterium]|nr:iron ABC transporter permease [Chloroflexota bacterium]